MGMSRMDRHRPEGEEVEEMLFCDEDEEETPFGLAVSPFPRV